MQKRILTVLGLLSALSINFAYAEETHMQYQTKKLPDGSTEMTYSSSDGTKMRQVQRADGTVEVHVVDEQGNETKTIQHPDGRVDVKTNTKSK